MSSTNSGWAETWWQVACWLAPYADQGYGGFFREENDDQPTMLIIRDGEPQVREFDDKER